MIEIKQILHRDQRTIQKTNGIQCQYRNTQKKLALRMRRKEVSEKEKKNNKKEI